jgi:hypothetical protein
MLFRGAGSGAEVPDAPTPAEQVQMRQGLGIFTALVISASAAGACGGGHDQPATTSNGNVSQTPVTSTPSGATNSATTAPVEQHHSKLGGAVVGAAVGHVLGGHAVAGAAAGALIQHERNKH